MSSTSSQNLMAQNMGPVDENGVLVDENGVLVDKRVVINEPNRTEWLQMFGDGSRGGGSVMAVRAWDGMSVWCMVYGVWCMVYGVWCMVYGVMALWRHVLCAMAVRTGF
jgi:hypothetical protein